MTHVTLANASIVLHFEILELRNFNSWHKKEGSVILLRLWRWKFLLQKNVYPVKLLDFVSCIVGVFFKQEKYKLHALWYFENTKLLLKQQKLSTLMPIYLLQATGSWYQHFLLRWTDK